MMPNFADLDAAFEKKHGTSLVYPRRKPQISNEELEMDGLGSFDIKSAGSFDLEKARTVKHDPTHMDWQYEPVGFKEFCESKDHMHLLPQDWKEGDEGALSDRQVVDCLAILGDDPKKMFDPKVRRYVFGALLWSKGSGKDYICSIIHAYVVYILLCLRNPHQFFGFAPGEACDILNVGKKGEQAERVYFNKFRARILKWPWMLEKYNVTDENKRFKYNGKGFPNCKVGTRSAEWMDKNIRAFAENSGNPEALEGYNIVFYICDEISGWVSAKERDKAHKILHVLRTSQTSRNTLTLTGLGMAISYPRQDDDIMFQLEKESQVTNSNMFFSRAYQWEVKPKRFYSGNTFKFNAGTSELPEWFDIPTELDEEYFKNNPEEAKMKYLLRPRAVGEPVFEYTERIDSLAYLDRQPLFKVDTDYVEAVDGKGSKVYYIRKRIIGFNRVPDPHVDYVAWIDAGETTCDASLSIGHCELVQLKEGVDVRMAKAVVLDDTIVWEPDSKLRRIVDIGSMTEVCLSMLNYISLKAVWWDTWNSGTGVHDLRMAGVMCDRHNLNGLDYDFFKGILYTSQFLAPVCPSVKKGIGQIKHLSRTRTGNVTPGSTLYKKDIADTWCGITTLLLGALSTSNLRAGRAPAAITVSSSPLMAKGNSLMGAISSAAMARQTNPFSGVSSVAGRQLITTKPGMGHSDLFPGLMGVGGQSRRLSQTPKSGNPQPGGRSAFPRGVRL